MIACVIIYSEFVREKLNDFFTNTPTVTIISTEGATDRPKYVVVLTPAYMLALEQQHFMNSSFHLILFVGIKLNICNTLRELLVPNSRANIYKFSVPMELPCWNHPWPCGAVLHCPIFLHCLCLFLELITFLAFNIDLLRSFFAHFYAKSN